MLTRLLVDLEAQWKRLDAPIAEALRPGLTDVEIDAVAVRLGVVLPEELRVLWAWHDGAEPGSHRSIGPGGYSFLTTEEVVARHEFNVRVHPPEPDDDPEVAEMYWHPSWVPFMTENADRLYIDCLRKTRSGSSPVRHVSWEWEDYDVDLAPSLAAAVSMWTWLLANGYYTWVQTDRVAGWDVSYTDIPPFARLTLA